MKKQDNIYIIPDEKRIGESCALAQRFGACFEYNDFYVPALLDDEEEFARRIRMYRELDRDRSADTLHGAFYDVTVHSDDPLIRRVSEKRVYQSMEAAEKLSVRGVVFHTGTIPNFRGEYYHQNWVDKNTKFWTKICREYRELEIYIENMFDMEPDFLLDLCRNMEEIPNFGVCLDYAHARVFGGRPRLWVETLAPYIRHMHINDNDGMVDQHNTVGRGCIDWNAYDRSIRAEKIIPSVLVEMRSIEKQEKSLEYLQEHRFYPYGGK